VNLVVALRAEAEPLIEHFQLESAKTHDLFPIYRGGTFWLVISGIGRVLAGAAVAHLHHVSGGKADVPWLNVGIAGHQQLSIGRLLLAGRIEERATGRRWYPPYTLASPVQRSELITVDRPELDYPCCSAYDMEASGFYAVASRCSTGELVQCLKVVSDNPGKAPDFRREQVLQLIADQLEAIAAFAGELADTGEQHAKTRVSHLSVDRYLGQWHFTVTQRHRLNDLLRRWGALNAHDPWRDIKSSRGSAEVLQQLERLLAQQPVRFTRNPNHVRASKSWAQDR